MGKIIMAVLDVFVLLGAIIGGWLVFMSIFEQSAAQTAAGAALGIGIAAIPYFISAMAHRQIVRAWLDRNHASKG